MNDSTFEEELSRYKENFELFEKICEERLNIGLYFWFITKYPKPLENEIPHLTIEKLVKYNREIEELLLNLV